MSRNVIWDLTANIMGFEIDGEMDENGPRRMYIKVRVCVCHLVEAIIFFGNIQNSIRVLVLFQKALKFNLRIPT